MSIDSKIFVACNKEDVINIGSSVTEALNTYVRGKLDNYWKQNTDCASRLQFLVNKDLKEHSNKFTNGVNISTHDFGTFIFNFGSGDDFKRSLFMFSDCSSDYSDVYDGYKLIFSIGYWGSSDEIMNILAEALRPYGDIYYDFNDCDDKGFIKI